MSMNEYHQNNNLFQNEILHYSQWEKVSGKTGQSQIFTFWSIQW